MTYEQLIYKLEDEKKLEISDHDYAIKLLKEHSYFALISGYKGPFKQKNGTYKIHVSIQDIYALYLFDDALRALFLQYILKIEKHMKSLISYSFCKAYGEKQQHGNIPLWVMMKALTLGTVSKLYSFLPQSIQHNVSKEFEYVHEGMLVQMLDLLARVRNVCAHNERLFDYKYQKGTIDDTYVHNALAIEKKKGQYIKGKNDLFAVVIVLKYLLSEEDFSSIVQELEKITEQLFLDTRVIEKLQLYKYMGFTENWFDIDACAKTGEKKICE